MPRRSWFQVLVLATTPSLVACVATLSGAEQAPTVPATRPVSAQADARALALLVQAAGTHRLVLLGEMHGTREIPALVGALIDHEVKRGRSVILALEISSREQARVDRYLASSGHDADRQALLAGEHWQDAMHDGRDSQAMLALIERVRRMHVQGADVPILLFDPGGNAFRDQQMADNLRAAAHRSPQAALLVLTGNVHAMTRPPPGGMFLDGKRIESPITAGRYLSDLEPLSIDIEGAAGEFQACEGGHCAKRAVHPGLPATVALSRNAPAESAWDFTLVLPHFTASPSAVQAPGISGSS